ncbi:hypothetical protein CI102_2030 [Trichoderma harzianum]|jgi:hypothetical protein|uniref:Uncharacterized protein n=1 Tax=Trichoderma harzianum CBS 226.95 TaxID=983964 RepID=A0A2T4A3N1_TRIHA|nr:hypothetical protein M431DRAFT_224842 [Trichoderma harzianum CBS 226.95]PKK53582.1 hypothetical protein CI102_2030 [Trichoderma harzianum]PTB51670.1 hypothetical protein M431DRAFT_224842 [Trichoderma harzianum CBS 226.95]
MCSFWACSGIFVEGRAACIRAKEHSTNALRSFCLCCVYKDEREECVQYIQSRARLGRDEFHSQPLKHTGRHLKQPDAPPILLVIAIDDISLCIRLSHSLTLSFASVRSGSAETAISACPQQNSCNPSAATRNLAAPLVCRLCMSGTF